MCICRSPACLSFHNKYRRWGKHCVIIPWKSLSYQSMPPVTMHLIAQPSQCYVKSRGCWSGPLAVEVRVGSGLFSMGEGVYAGCRVILGRLGSCGPDFISHKDDWPVVLWCSCPLAVRDPSRASLPLMLGWTCSFYQYVWPGVFSTLGVLWMAQVSWVFFLSASGSWGGIIVASHLGQVT